MTCTLPSYKNESATILAEARKEGVTLFGAGGFARALFQALEILQVKVLAFVVSDGAGMPAELYGCPVIPLVDLPSPLCQIPLWIAVFNRSPGADLGAIQASCRERGMDRVLQPQEYFELVEAKMGWRFWLSNRVVYSRHWREIEAAYHLLDDDLSRSLFDQTLRFRILGGSPPSPTNDIQYFPENVIKALQNRKGGVSFVDGGAYDGDTLSLACKQLNLKAAWAFEPDLKNFGRLAVNGAILGVPVTCFPCGLSDKTEMIGFAADGTEGSAVSADGNGYMQAVRLDDCLAGEPLDYIKLDVEGHELQAIEGARRNILLHRPTLAIAAYHRWDDLWKIPLLINEMSQNYRICYRVHESNTFDSVLYAYVPS